jgi:anti-anti-sigma factor
MTVSPFSESTFAPGSIAGPIASVIAIRSELVRGTETNIVNALLPRVREESIALDLSNVERIDAAGIAALITLYCTAIEAGTEFSVVDPSSHVLELLCIVGLAPILVSRTVSETAGAGRPGGSMCSCFERSAA